MPIPLFVIGAKCQYTFNAQNLPPGLSIVDNYIVGKVSIPGSWQVTLTAIPSNPIYPTLQKITQVTISEKITREVIQDIVVTQECSVTVVNFSNYLVMDLDLVTQYQGNVYGFGDIYLDITSQNQGSIFFQQQDVVESHGFASGYTVYAQEENVVFCSLNGSTQLILDTIGSSPPSIVENSATSFNVYVDYIYLASNLSLAFQLTNLSSVIKNIISESLLSFFVSNQGIVAVATLPNVIGAQLANQSTYSIREEVSLVSTAMTNASLVTLKDDQILVQTQLQNQSSATLKDTQELIQLQLQNQSLVILRDTQVLMQLQLQGQSSCTTVALPLLELKTNNYSQATINT